MTEVPQQRRDPEGRPIFEIEPDTQLAKFLMSTAPVQIIQGPVGCLSADTEFLTSSGWKRISEYHRGDDIAEWDAQTGEVLFRLPVSFVDQPCGSMWHFHNGHTLSMVLSDEHRCPVFNWNGRFGVKTASALAARPSRHEIPVSFTVPSYWRELALTDDEIRLAIAIKADGCMPRRGSQCVVTVRKDRKKERMRALLDAAGMDFAEHQHSTRETELTFAFQRGGYTKGFGPQWWKASRRQLEIILAECLLWDGLAEHDEQRYFTTSKGDADFIQYAAHATGRRATIGCYDDPRGPEWKPNYTVYIAAAGSPKAKVQLRADTTKIDRVPAPGGRKYCFETATGFFVARHDDCVFITGNSGKSKICNLKIGALAHAQKPGPDDIKRIRVGVVRNTYPELKTTTIRTWLDTFPENLHGPLVWSQPPRQVIRWGDAVIETDFLALDKEEDVKKIRSGEYTLFYVNELQFIIKVLFDEMDSRHGRFPAMKDGGPTWHGIIADMNAPDEDHFIALMTGQADYPENTPDDEKLTLPPEWDFFMQPPGLLEQYGADGRSVEGYAVNPVAENIKWLPKDYYLNLIKGKSRAFIKSRVLNRVALVVDGDPVWPGFREDVHVSREMLSPAPAYELCIGLDFGRNPAAVFGQHVNNRIVILAELQAFNEGAVTFAPKVKRFLEQNFGGMTFRAFGDPKGMDKTQNDDRTAYEIFGSYGIAVQPAPVKQNMIETRIQAVELPLGEMYDGRPRFLLSPRCRSLKVGMAGRYCYKKIAGADGRTHREPDKNRYSHLADALQYLCLGMGEGRRMVGLTPANAPKPMMVYRPKSRRLVRA